MRIANSFEAKPPNTTECTAPILAQANMAITASGIIGIYIITRSLFLTPCFIKAPENCETLNSICEYDIFCFTLVIGLS